MSQNKSHGFTLVEVLVIAPIVILTIGAFVGVMVNLTGEVLKTQAQNNAVQRTQDTLDTIERDIKLSGAYLAGNELVAPSPQSYTDGGAGVNHFTNVTTDSTKPIKNMLILRTFATDKNPIDSARQPVYTNQPSGSCDAANKTTNKLQSYNVVYFVKNDSLWRRTLLQTGRGTPDLCDTIWQRPSCAPTATKNAACLVNDIRLVDNITKFDIEYFPNATATTPNTTATSTAATIDTRNDTLSGMDTVRVTIETTNSVANDDVKHSAALRATRLNIASEPPLNIFLELTSQPTNQSILVSESATFRTSANLNGATFQWQRSTNGGSIWANIAGATSSTYSINNADRAWNNYKYRAIVKDATDTLTTNVATLTVNQWGSLALQNSWSNYANSYAGEGYTRTNAGVVMLKGLVERAGTPASGETIGTLPIGYRPTGTLIFMQMSSSGNPAGRVDVYTDGRVIYNAGAGSGGWMSLEGIKFLPAGSSYTYTDTAPLNGWANYGGSFETAQYATDGVGRTHTQGLVRYGTVTNGTPIIAPPVASRADEYMHYPARSNGGFDFVGLNPSGTLAKGGANGYLSLNAMYYPNTFTSWSILGLTNGWTWYDAGGGQFTKPRYTKGSDDIVTLRGLVRSGTTTSGTVIANLPVGFRPKERVLMTNVSNAAQGRVDILPTGEVLFMSGSNIWFSLDAITFVAEQ